MDGQHDTFGGLLGVTPLNWTSSRFPELLIRMDLSVKLFCDRGKMIKPFFYSHDSTMGLNGSRISLDVFRMSFFDSRSISMTRG